MFVHIVYLLFLGSQFDLHTRSLEDVHGLLHISCVLCLLPGLCRLTGRRQLLPQMLHLALSCCCSLRKQQIHICNGRAQNIHYIRWFYSFKFGKHISCVSIKRRLLQRFHVNIIIPEKTLLNFQLL